MFCKCRKIFELVDNDILTNEITIKQKLNKKIFIKILRQYHVITDN